MKINQQDIERLQQLVGDARRVVITGHMSPDGDAIGSSLGLQHVLRAMGKDVWVVVPDDYSRQLAFLPGTKDIVIYCRQTAHATELLNQADLIFCLDYNDIKRIDRLAPAVEHSPARRVMIDHHLDPVVFCDITISHPELSSTCMLLFLVLKAAGWLGHVTPAAAQCLLAGMMTDTGNFSYNANDPEIYPVVGWLVGAGVDHDELTRRLFNIFSENCLRLNAYAISRKMHVWREYGAALITLTRDELNMHHYSRGDTEGLVNRPLAIPGVVYSCFLREEERYIKVSMRSLGDFPCDKVCAEYFNGGGHLNAAGGEFFGSMEQAVEVFKSILPLNKKKYIK